MDELEVLVAKLLAVDGLSTSALRVYQPMRLPSLCSLHFDVRYHG